MAWNSNQNHLAFTFSMTDKATTGQKPQKKQTRHEVKEQ